MTQEQKARAYDNALEIARKINSGEGVAAPPDWTIYEVIFPELKEGEDEKIRKELISFLDTLFELGKNIVLDRYDKSDCARWIDWLEKQGEKKSDPRKIILDELIYADDIYQMAMNDEMVEEAKAKAILALSKIGISKLLVRKKQDVKPQGKTALEVIHEEKVDNVNKFEPKFKGGDWVVCEVTGSVWQIKNCIEHLSNHRYGYLLTDGGYIGSDEVNHYHLWTIQDAKDGDVLYLQHDGKEHIIIYKGIIKERFRTFVSAYCAYNGIVDAFCFADVSKYGDIAYGVIMPATKEQRDLLFQKMKEAGYEWDEEKKELRKMEQKPKWSEEDEELCQDTLDVFEALANDLNPSEDWGKLYDWLKSIKQRMKQ